MKMKIQWSEIRWGRGVLAGILISIISLLGVTLIVFIYAFALAFQARGAPDVARINRFAQQFAPWAVPLLSLLLTIGGAAWVARKAKVAAYPNGIFTGLIVAVIGLGISLIPHGTFYWQEIIWFLLTIGAGFLGGFLATLGRQHHQVAVNEQ
jgi:hypothetical protein